MNRNIDYQKVKEFWDESAKSSIYEDDIQSGMLYANKLAAQYRKRKEEEHFDRIIKLSENMHVLEIGCGTGRWSFYVAPNVKRVVAIDLSENMIEIAKNKQISENINNIEFHCVSACDFHTNEKFDLVYFSSMLQYVSDGDVSSILKKLPKWLKNNGICLSRDTVSLKQRIEKTGDYLVIYRTRDDYIKMFEKHNLYLTYNGQSYKRSISYVASRCFLNRYFPNSSLRTLIILDKLISPPGPFLRYIYKKVRKTSVKLPNQRSSDIDIKDHVLLLCYFGIVTLVGTKQCQKI